MVGWRESFTGEEGWKNGMGEEDAYYSLPSRAKRAKDTTPEFKRRDNGLGFRD